MRCKVSARQPLPLAAPRLAKWSQEKLVPGNKVGIVNGSAVGLTHKGQLLSLPRAGPWLFGSSSSEEVIQPLGR